MKRRILKVLICLVMIVSCLAPIAAIDAVLNFESHSYLYFCAKEDFSGRHYFSKSLSEHNRYAKRYAEALSRAKIR